MSVFAQDEKSLQFLRTVPQPWRLFWTIQSIGISFALALVAITHIGDSSRLLEKNNTLLETWPTWVIWGLNPTGVTLSSILLSWTLQAVCEISSESWGSLDEPSFGSMFQMAVVGIFALFRREKERFRGQPCFFVTQGMWLAQGVISLLYDQRILGKYGFPVAVDIRQTSTSAGGGGDLVMTDDRVFFMCMNAVLATGLAAKVFTFLLRTRFRSIGSAPGEVLADRCGGFADSRVPSLLVGWGIGYWVSSLLAVLAGSWQGGEWNNAPVIVTLIAYLVVPCFYVAGIFMVADSNFLGPAVASFVKPAVDTLKSSGRVEHWILVTVFRDTLIAWTRVCDALSFSLSHSF